MRPVVLLVEDDLGLREALVRSLDAEGFSVVACETGRGFVERALSEHSDALVIDVGLPDADGRDVCQALRARGVRTPVLFVTARDALADRLGGFSAGGDDFVVKPFDIEELCARLHALIRRAGRVQPSPHADLALDASTFTVAHDGRHETLAPTEFRLLGALAAADGRAVSRQDLIASAWPHGAIVHDNTLDVYAGRLRRKLAGLGPGPVLVTARGIGYALRWER